jgi:hypothetical protein
MARDLDDANGDRALSGSEASPAWHHVSDLNRIYYTHVSVYLVFESLLLGATISSVSADVVGSVPLALTALGVGSCVQWILVQARARYMLAAPMEILAEHDRYYQEVEARRRQGSKAPFATNWALTGYGMPLLMLLTWLAIGAALWGS